MATPFIEAQMDISEHDRKDATFVIGIMDIHGEELPIEMQAANAASDESECEPQYDHSGSEHEEYEEYDEEVEVEVDVEAAPVQYQEPPRVDDREEFPSLAEAFAVERRWDCVSETSARTAWDVVSDVSDAGTDWDVVSETSAVSAEWSDIEADAAEAPTMTMPLVIDNESDEEDCDETETLGSLDFRTAASRGRVAGEQRAAEEEALAEEARMARAQARAKLVEEHAAKMAEMAECSTSASTAFDSHDQWQCSSCTFVNIRGVLDCVMCQHPCDDGWRQPVKTLRERKVEPEEDKRVIAMPHDDMVTDEELAAFFCSLRARPALTKRLLKQSAPLRRHRRPLAERDQPEPEIEYEDLDADTLLDLYLTFKSTEVLNRRKTRNHRRVATRKHNNRRR